MKISTINAFLNNQKGPINGGETGIRTLGTFNSTYSFQACTLNSGIGIQHLFNVQTLKIAPECDQRESRFY